MFALGARHTRQINKSWKVSWDDWIRQTAAYMDMVLETSSCPPSSPLVLVQIQYVVQHDNTKEPRGAKYQSVVGAVAISPICCLLQQANPREPDPIMVPSISELFGKSGTRCGPDQKQEFGAIYQ